MKLAWCAPLVLAACHDARTKEPAPAVVVDARPAPVLAPPTAIDAAPAVKSGLTVTIDGKPREMASVIAAPDGDDVSIQLTSFPYSCQEWVDGFRDSKFDDEITIEVDLQPNLTPDGQLGWAIAGTAFQGTTSSAQDGGDPVPGAALDPAAGAHSKLDVALDLETLDDPKRTAHLAGTIDALGCGPLGWRGNDAEPVPPVLPGVTMTIAGKVIPVGGAMIVSGKNGRQLMLASGPVSCVEGGGFYDEHHFLSSGRASVELSLSWSTGAKVPDRGELAGTWMGKGADTTTWDGGRLTATPSTVGKGKSVAISLGGATRMGDYTVALAGKVTAAVCR